MIENNIFYSKLGWFPKDWKLMPLNQLVQLKVRPFKMEDNKEYTLVKVKRRYEGVAVREKLQGKDILVKSQFLIKERDFIISKRQIPHGACGLVPKELENAIVSNEYNVLEVKNEDYLDIEYFNRFVQMSFMKHLFYVYSNGVHIEKMLFKYREWAKVQIPIPPLPEQQKIAQILTTCDTAIEKTTTLITQLKQRKKGLMQQLLTGKMRLKGFSDEWEEVKLETIAWFQEGPGLRTWQFRSQGMRVINITNLKEKGYLDLSLTNRHISLEEWEEKYKHFSIDDKDMVMASSGNSYCKLAIVRKRDLPIMMNTSVIRFKPSKNTSYYFLFNYLKSQLFKNQIDRLITGGAQPNFGPYHLRRVKLRIPKIEEQIAIAQVLTAADEEISKYEEQLTALQTQKRGLMQVLLTGKVRVAV
jgi:type I restriction enzyme S subunit